MNHFVMNSLFALWTVDKSNNQEKWHQTDTNMTHQYDYKHKFEEGFIFLIVILEGNHTFMIAYTAHSDHSWAPGWSWKVTRTHDFILYYYLKSI